MKKILVTLLTALFAAGFSVFSVYAAVPDIAACDEASLSELRKAVASGQRLFDAAELLTEPERADIESKLKNIEAQYGHDVSVMTVVNNSYSTDLHKYSDFIYYESELGKGKDRDGSLMVIDLGDEAHRGVQIYAQGNAAKYFTDRAIDQILDSYGGGVVSYLSGGEYYDAMQLYAKAVDQLYAQGIQKKPFIKLWQLFVALIGGVVAGLSPVKSVKKQYAMEREKRLAQGVNLAYRATAAFVYAPVEARVLDKVTKSIIIPKAPSNGQGPGSGGQSFGGGKSTMHRSMGGGSHTTGGRKF